MKHLSKETSTGLSYAIKVRLTPRPSSVYSVPALSIPESFIVCGRACSHPWGARLIGIIKACLSTERMSFVMTTLSSSELIEATKKQTPSIEKHRGEAIDKDEAPTGPCRPCQRHVPGLLSYTEVSCLSDHHVKTWKMKVNHFVVSRSSADYQKSVKTLHRLFAV